MKPDCFTTISTTGCQQNFTSFTFHMNSIEFLGSNWSPSWFFNDSMRGLVFQFGVSILQCRGKWLLHCPHGWHLQGAGDAINFLAGKACGSCGTPWDPMGDFIYFMSCHLVIYLISSSKFYLQTHPMSSNETFWNRFWT